MAAAIARHAGARYVVVTDVNPYRLDLAQKAGADLALDVRFETVAEAQKKLGMKEGFDVGLEMSGNCDAFSTLLEKHVPRRQNRPVGNFAQVCHRLGPGGVQRACRSKASMAGRCLKPGTK